MKARSRRTLALASVGFAAAAAYGCNAIFGIEDVTLESDGGTDAARDGSADASVPDTFFVDAGDASQVDVTMASDATPMDATPSPCLDAATLLSDPRNCGACGHDCLLGGCAAGTCQPFLVSAGKLPVALAVGAGRVYLVDYNAQEVIAYATDGGGPAGAIFNPVGVAVAVSGNTVYVGGNDLNVYACALDLSGCSSVWVEPSGVNVAGSAMVGDDAGVYWGTERVDGGGATVYRLLAGEAPTPLATDLDADVSGLATDAVYVYFVNGGQVWRALKDAVPGTPPDLVGYGYLGNRAVLPLPEGLFFSDQVGHSINILPPNGDAGYGPLLTFIGGPSWSPAGLAAGGNTLYWANQVADGGIYSCADTSCNTPKTLASEGYSELVVSDGRSLFFTTRSSTPDDAGSYGGFYQVVP